MKNLNFTAEPANKEITFLKVTGPSIDFKVIHPAGLLESSCIQFGDDSILSRTEGMAQCYAIQYTAVLRSGLVRELFEIERYTAFLRNSGGHLSPNGVLDHDLTVSILLNRENCQGN